MRCLSSKPLPRWTKVWSARPLSSSTRFRVPRAANVSPTPPRCLRRKKIRERIDHMCQQGRLQRTGLQRQAQGRGQAHKKVMRSCSRRGCGHGHVFVHLVRHIARQLLARGATSRKKKRLFRPRRVKKFEYYVPLVIRNPLHYEVVVTIAAILFGARHHRSSQGPSPSSVCCYCFLLATRPKNVSQSAPAARPLWPRCWKCSRASAASSRSNRVSPE